MKIERADRQTSPLVEGRFYLVPTVRAKWYGKVADWPVIGPLHEDREILGFDLDHYHVDARFLPRDYPDIFRAFSGPVHADTWAVRRAKNWGEPMPSLPSPVLKRRKCVRASVPFSLPWSAAVTPVHELRRRFAGQQCVMGKGGWVCPHRKASLGSIEPEVGTAPDGSPAHVITCPLHGLRIDAVTGLVLPA